MKTRFERFWPVVALAGVVQCLLLFVIGDATLSARTFGAGICLLLLAIPLIASRLIPEEMLIMLMVTGCLGGLGMLIGSEIDARVSEAVPVCHVQGCESYGEVSGTMVNWMNGLMLVGCLPGCWLLCPRFGRCGQNLCTHFLCAVGMCFGMIAGGNILGAAWSAAVGAKGGMHLAMLLGMLGGVALVYLMLYAAWCQKPEHENQDHQASG